MLWHNDDDVVGVAEMVYFFLSRLERKRLVGRKLESLYLILGDGWNWHVLQHHFTISYPCRMSNF